jgi:general secretion pathway protein G
MESPTVSGKRGGFTLIELLIVMSIIGLLLALSLPRYFNSLERSKEIALAENLKVLRSQIDRFYGDRGRYPDTLEELVEAKYLRAVPIDPITESSESWRFVAPAEGTGVMDIHSGAEGSTRNGVPYVEL